MLYRMDTNVLSEIVKSKFEVGFFFVCQKQYISGSYLMLVNLSSLFLAPSAA